MARSWCQRPRRFELRDDLQTGLRMGCLRLPRRWTQQSESRLLDDQGDGSQHDGDYRIVRLVL